MVWLVLKVKEESVESVVTEDNSAVGVDLISIKEGGTIPVEVLSIVVNTRDVNVFPVMVPPGAVGAKEISSVGE